MKPVQDETKRNNVRVLLSCLFLSLGLSSCGIEIKSEKSKPEATVKEKSMRTYEYYRLENGMEFRLQLFDQDTRINPLRSFGKDITTCSDYFKDADVNIASEIENRLISLKGFSSVDGKNKTYCAKKYEDYGVSCVSKCVREDNVKEMYSLYPNVMDNQQFLLYRFGEKGQLLKTVKEN